MATQLDSQIDATLGSAIYVNKEKVWRPIVPVDLNGDNLQNLTDVVSKLQKSVSGNDGAISTLNGDIQTLTSEINQTNQNVAAIGVPPEVITGVSATESPTNIGNKTYSLVSVSFTRNLTDPKYAKTDIWIKGYKGNTNPVLIASVTDSPAEFILETTQETLTVYAQSIGMDGTPSAFSSAPTTTVVLDGVTSAPPAPSIAQMLTAISISGSTVGWQFAFNFLHGIVSDTIDGYWIYKVDVHSAPTPPASRFQFVKHSPNIGVYTFQDITGNSTHHYYYVSAVSNASNLESSLSDAGDGVGGGSVTTVFRPTTQTGTGSLYSNPTNAYDGSATTFALASVGNGAAATETWAGFAAAGSPISINLKITSEVDDSGGSASLDYSKDNGVTWANVYGVSANRSQTTDVISLPNTQDLTQVKVRASANSTSSPVTGVGHKIYEIWIEVTS